MTLLTLPAIILLRTSSRNRRAHYPNDAAEAELLRPVHSLFVRILFTFGESKIATSKAVAPGYSDLLW
jgi:hypothetical protein